MWAKPAAQRAPFAPLAVHHLLLALLASAAAHFAMLGGANDKAAVDTGIVVIVWAETKLLCRCKWECTDDSFIDFVYCAYTILILYVIARA